MDPEYIMNMSLPEILEGLGDALMNGAEEAASIEQPTWWLNGAETDCGVQHVETNPLPPASTGLMHHQHQLNHHHHHTSLFPVDDTSPIESQFAQSLLSQPNQVRQDQIGRSMSSQLNQRQPSQDSGQTPGNQKTAAAIRSKRSREKTKEIMETLKKENQKLMESEKASREKIEKLTAEKETLKSEKEKGTENERVLTEKIEKLTVEKEILKNEKEKATKNEETLKNENKKAMENERILTEKIGKLTEEKITLMNKITKLKEEKTTLINDIGKLGAEKEQIIAWISQMEWKEEMKKLTAIVTANTKSIEMLAAQYTFLSQSISYRQPNEQTPTPNRQMNLLKIHRPLGTVVIDLVKEKHVTLAAPKEWRENSEGFRHSSGKISTQNRPSCIARKVVLKLDVHSSKDRSKALKVVTGLSGIDSASIDIKDKLTVIGDVDPVCVVRKLRKLAYTEILTVGPVKEEKKDGGAKKDDGRGSKKSEYDIKEESDQISELVKPYGAYTPYMAIHRAISAEEDPNSCVIC